MYDLINLNMSFSRQLLEGKKENEPDSPPELIPFCFVFNAE